MSIRGEKILVDLGSDSDEEPSRPPPPVLNFIADVQERKVGRATPPKPPTQKKAENGFPVHRKRSTQSRFKSSRSTEQQPNAGDRVGSKGPEAPHVPQPLELSNPVDEERRQIDEENRLRLASMSDAEVQQERQELFETLNPSLLQALLRRSKLDQGGESSDFPGLQDKGPDTSPKPKGPTKKVTFASDPVENNQSTRQARLDKTSTNIPLESNENDDDDIEDQTTLAPSIESAPAGSIHFPRPDQPPDLDPNSESFLEDLHQKYFPSLPADPEKLEWMRSATGDSSYSTSQAGLDPKDIRFAFSGALIPPSTAANIPVTAGLHHHGDAPNAAGYTIPELARLARSYVPAQRCIAFQTLGRILYRLGKGEFGDPSEGSPGTVGAEETLGELARGLWAEMEKEQVVNICTNESEGSSMTGQTHISAQAYATEAVWLWQKGGGRRWRTA